MRATGRRTCETHHATKRCATGNNGSRKRFGIWSAACPNERRSIPGSLAQFSREGYRLEKVVYESQPDFHISANLYIPTTGSPPYPGVLFQMGHSTNGKAYAGYQKCCQGLARLGFVVLAFDPMGQGERTYYPGPVPSRTRLRGGADDEHTVPGKQMLLVGDSV